MTHEQLIEFAWGLANSKLTFLWIMRPDLISGELTVVFYGNQRKELIGKLVPTRTSVEPHVNRVFLYSLWLEFDFGECFSWRAYVMLAIFLRSTY